MKNKKLYILSSRGDSGYGEGEPNVHMNFQTTYLKTVFNIMGVQDIKTVSLDNEEYGGEHFAKSQREIYAQIANMK
nr:NAD(P)H-dependent oxidoreductase [Anseongella ginsenosidimutans]